MIGLDFRNPVRAICLEKLLEHQFSVRSCEVKADLSQISHQFSPVSIALPDIYVLNKSISDKKNKENHENIIWDQRGNKGVIFPKEKADKILGLLQQHQLVIQVVDIESEAIARALQLLCDVKNNCFVILYIDKNSLWISIFEAQQKIFFYQENILNDNQDMIIERGFKLFKTQFPEVIIEAYYAVGESAAKIAKWGKIPDITQKLEFESDLHQSLFKSENTQWLLACGLSLWDKKSSWNLLPWREHEKQKDKKNLFKLSLKILYGLGVIILSHAILLLALHFQDKHNTVLEQKISKLDTKAQTVNQIEQKTHLLQSQIKTLEKLSAGQLLPTKFLENLSKSMPDGVFLNSLTLADKKITLTGCAETKIQANILLSKLKQTVIFKNPNLKNIAQDESTPPYHFDFTIEMGLV